MTERKVLFLCVGNSCRSQMAEAIVNGRMSGWHAFSAGSRPASAVHPLAIRALDEIGIKHDGTPKGAERFAGVSFDTVVTLCDESSEECPVWLGDGHRIRAPYPDPAEAEGTDADRLAAYRQVRDDLLRDLPGLLA